MNNRLITDTTQYSNIDHGDIIAIGGREYKVTGNAKEQRFGLEDPKFWVKRAVDTETKEGKIIKLVFYETFNTNLRGVSIKCFRDPEKEAAILKLVGNYPSFMHGTSDLDSEGNNVRILDIVRGPNFYNLVGSMEIKHEKYFHDQLPSILKKLIKAFEGIGFLHRNGFRHGDIRNDHIIVETKSGNYVWIDFDYDYEAPENPFSLDLFGMANILLYAIGKGLHLYYNIIRETRIYGDLKDNIDTGDFSILDPSRFLNLRKLYPYIPETMNDILMHFSESSETFYESTDELIEDLNRCTYAFYK